MSRIVLFSPHPDDIAISMGGLASMLAEAGADISIVMVTDGSEAAIPPNVLAEHGGLSRGQIRIAEAREEITRLGFPPDALRVFEHQRWFTQHQTRPEFLNSDGSLRDVTGFEPAPVDDAALDEFRAAVAGAEICAAPDPNDRLRMHRIVTQAVNAVRGRTRLLTYECLSTVAVTGPQILFGFETDYLETKCRAIRAHRSMAERRRQFGGYSNAGSEPYDVIVTRINAALAADHEVGMPFAERYGWS